MLNNVLKSVRPPTPNGIQVKGYAVDTGVPKNIPNGLKMATQSISLYLETDSLRKEWSKYWDSRLLLPLGWVAPATISWK